MIRYILRRCPFGGKQKSNMAIRIFIALLVSYLIMVNFINPISASKDSEALPLENYEVKDFLENKAKVIEPGVLPNSFWYWSDNFAEEIKFIFTVGKETKGDFLLDLAEERLAEMRSLSESGITKYTDRLITKHEGLINKAESFYKTAQVDGVEMLKEGQSSLEKEIILREMQIKKEAKDAPSNYEQKRDEIVGGVGLWFKRLLGHLQVKRGEIDENKAQLVE